MYVFNLFNTEVIAANNQNSSLPISVEKLRTLFPNLHFTDDGYINITATTVAHLI